jgi:signal transduction histidine kinase
MNTVKSLLTILFALILTSIISLHLSGIRITKLRAFLLQGSPGLVRLSMIEQKQFLRLELVTAMRGLYQPLTYELLHGEYQTLNLHQRILLLNNRPELSSSFLVAKDGGVAQISESIELQSLDSAMSKVLKTWSEGELPHEEERFFGARGKWIHLKTSKGNRDGLMLIPLASENAHDTAVCILFEPKWLIDRLPSLFDSVRVNWLTFPWKEKNRSKEYDFGFGVFSPTDTLYWWGDNKPTVEDEDYQRDAVSVTEVTIAPEYNLGVIFGEKRFYNQVTASSRGVAIFIIFNVIGLLAVIALLVAFLLLVRSQSTRNQIALGHLAHSVKTPVARLQLAADILEGGQVSSPEEERKVIQTVSGECRQLRRAVENAALSLEGGKIALHKEPGDLASLVIETTDAWRQSFDQVGIRLVVEGLEKPVQALFDRDKIRLALDNLIDNALRHTYLNLNNLKAEPALVTVSLKSEERSIALSVSDSGAGIPAAEIKNVFKRFSRSGKDPLTGVSGLGLGLALVKEIVERHGGKVKAESAEVGGAKFLIQMTNTKTNMAPRCLVCVARNDG